jgi:pilus assembly protein CpaF
VARQDAIVFPANERERAGLAAAPGARDAPGTSTAERLLPVARFRYAPPRAPPMSLFSESLRAFLKPIVQFLDDPDVSEVLVNNWDEVWIEKGGKLQRTLARFTEDSLNAAARNIAQYVGRPLSAEHPRVDARLPDGSRIHVILAPVSRRGTTISIRKFRAGGYSLDDLIAAGTLSPEEARLLAACVVAKRNIVVAGGTGSGKTTMLNVLGRLIPAGERVLTIEDAAELQLPCPHLVALESRPPDDKGRGAITIRDLLHSALRLRPDRIVVGEVRGGECFDLLQAMNTGHGGTLSTAHANTPLETLSRLESLCLMADVGLPLRAVRAQIAAALDVIVCTSRFVDGTRKVTHVSEVLPLADSGDYRVADLFTFTQTRRTEERVEGVHAPTGRPPTFRARLCAEGFEDLTAAFFDPATYGIPPPGDLPAEDTRPNARA